MFVAQVGIAFWEVLEPLPDPSLAGRTLSGTSFEGYRWVLVPQCFLVLNNTDSCCPMILLTYLLSCLPCHDRVRPLKP